MEITGTVDAVLQVKGNAVWSVSPDATVFEAIELMAQKNVGALLVVDADKTLGIISERDYTRRIALEGRNSRQVRVREITTGRVVAVAPDTGIDECLALMTHHRIRHLPVLQGDNIVGIVSIGDLVNWLISAQKIAINQLTDYISGQYPG
ncbi:MAG TPA: CBS domain-containing protein [Verrucomicrobiota bacterium]|nr:CBS domain-containing protein [Verrucomicrobiota bacterium]HNU51320.1 CBS domain-containing protein [Verrucomicrobiota bacterium]